MKIKTIIASIRQKIPSFKSWPFDAAITIALLALFISASQLIVTTPLFYALLFGPKVVVTGSGSKFNSDMQSGTYLISNEGYSPATKIEIGMVLLNSQNLQFFPDFGAHVTEKDEVALKNVRIEIERLLHGETVFMYVYSKKRGDKWPAGLADVFIKLGLPDDFPIVSYVRYSEGRGKVIHKVIKQSDSLLGKTKKVHSTSSAPPEL